MERYQVSEVGSDYRQIFEANYFSIEDGLIVLFDHHADAVASFPGDKFVIIKCPEPQHDLLDKMIEALPPITIDTPEDLDNAPEFKFFMCQANYDDLFKYEEAEYNGYKIVIDPLMLAADVYLAEENKFKGVTDEEE